MARGIVRKAIFEMNEDKKRHMDDTLLDKKRNGEYATGGQIVSGEPSP